MKEIIKEGPAKVMFISPGPHYLKCPFFKKKIIRHAKKQERVTYTQEQNKQYKLPLRGAGQRL